MKAQALASFPHIWLTCIGLLLFLSVFVGALFWVFRNGSREFYGRLGELPYHDDPRSGPEAGREHV